MSIATRALPAEHEVAPSGMTNVATPEASGGEVAAWPRRVLVATDGSASAKAAVAVARILAEHSRASAEMLTVYAPRVALPACRDRPGFNQCESHDRGAAAVQLAAVRRQRVECLSSEERRSWPLRCAVGDPCFAILELANEIAADLLVVSLGSREPWERHVGDRTALCLARHSSVPVYAASDCEQPARCIVVFPDGRIHAPTIRAAINCVPPGAKLWIALPDSLHQQLDGGAELGSGRDIVTRACGDNLQAGIDAIDIERVDIDGDMLSRVLQIGDDVSVQLIAAPNHGAPGQIRTFLPNLAEPLLYGARCSVLIVPDDVAAAAQTPSAH